MNDSAIDGARFKCLVDLSIWEAEFGEVVDEVTRQVVAQVWQMSSGDPFPDLQTSLLWRPKTTYRGRKMKYSSRAHASVVNHFDQWQNAKATIFAEVGSGDSSQRFLSMLWARSEFQPTRLTLILSCRLSAAGLGEISDQLSGLFAVLPERMTRLAAELSQSRSVAYAELLVVPNYLVGHEESLLEMRLMGRNEWMGKLQWLAYQRLPSDGRDLRGYGWRALVAHDLAESLGGANALRETNAFYSVEEVASGVWVQACEHVSDYDEASAERVRAVLAPVLTECFPDEIFIANGYADEPSGWTGPRLLGSAPDRPITPCPCCGYVVHKAGPGSWSICPICRWEDDLTQLRWPTLSVGANKMALIDAQRVFEQAELTPEQRGVLQGGPLEISKEPGWRPIDLSLDSFEDPYEPVGPWPDKYECLYWWRETFWRRRLV